MGEVILDNVTKIYPGGVRAVDGLDLAVGEGEFVVLVGPSGCGKSTTLRLIAGLEDLTSGTIRIGPRIVNDLPPRDRDLAIVFQNYALYPHLTVARNMAFSLMLRRRYAGWGNPLARLVAPARYRAACAERAEIEARVRAAAELLGIQELLRRRPQALSGGQRQRVAVGRALVRRPQAFLLDEPLSNLDARLRLELRAELKAVHRKVQTTTIYVTHDQEEAMTLGDRVAVMQAGRIQQCGTPLAVYGAPVNRFVAGFIGMPPMNFLEGRLIQRGSALLFGGEGGELALCPEHQRRLSASEGQTVVLGIRPDAAHPVPASAGDIRRAAPEGHGVLRATVWAVEALGDRVDTHVQTTGHERLVCRTAAGEPVTAGQTVDVWVDMTRVHFFAADTGGRNLLAPGAMPGAMPKL